MKNYIQNISDGDIQAYLENIKCSKISENERKACEELITMHECEMVVNCVKNNKSPGQDGLSAEFYKVFWNDLKDI